MVAELGKPNWHDLLPTIFTDQRRFLKTGKRRWQVQAEGRCAGIAVAWKPPTYDNYALNKDDFDRLLEKSHDGSLDVGFVVLATIENSTVTYVAHHEADAVHEALKDMPLRDGPNGPYWLPRKLR